VCIFNPNGHAAGNCLEEAILQGFLELVERDAVALWWYNRALRPALELDSFGDPYIAALRAHYRAMGWRLWALDITTDLGIPAFAAVAAPAAGERFCLGFGSHLDAQLALLRALTEVNQLFELDPARSCPGPAARSNATTSSTRPHRWGPACSRTLPTPVPTTCAKKSWIAWSAPAASAWKSWWSTCRARTSTSQWRKSWFRACVISGQGLGPDASTTYPPRWAGCLRG
jgi:hypothetical protein